MQPDDEPTVDVEIVASAAADELRFHSVPDVQVSFPGIGARESRRITARRNIDTPVQPGKAYHRVVATTWINTRLGGRPRLDKATPAGGQARPVK
jgi:hypothetical protein